MRHPVSYNQGLNPTTFSSVGMAEVLGAAGWEDHRELPKVHFQESTFIPRSASTTSETVRTPGAWQVAPQPFHPPVLDGLVYTVSERVVVFDPVTWTTEDIGEVMRATPVLAGSLGGLRAPLPRLSPRPLLHVRRLV